MDYYDKLGVRKYINAKGTMTYLGGSVMDSSVLKEMDNASKHFVDMNELHYKAGRYLASLFGVEGVCITNGASGGIAIATAACIAGKNKGRILQLPNTEGMNNEVLMLKAHRNLYDQAVGLSGAIIKDIGTTSFCCLESIENAISERSVMFLFVSESETVRGSVDFKNIVSIMHKKGIPVVVDAAAEVPPKSNILRHYNEGADLVIFSGGKEIRGPQCSGFILGRSSLIEACDENCCPHHAIGRSCKIDKENIIGLVRAVELFWEKDYTNQIKIWNEWVDRILSIIKCNERITCHKGYPIEPGVQPTSIPRAYFLIQGISNTDVIKQLQNLSLGIQIGCESGMLAINPQCLEYGQIDYITNCILNIAKGE